MKYLLLVLALSGFAYSEEYIITEADLLEMAKQDNPTLNEIEASFLQSDSQFKELEDKFGYELYGGYNHTDTKEKGIISFQPVFNNINQYQVGVKKYTKYGVVLDANTSIDQRSGKSEGGSDFKDIHTTKYELGFQLDLWKDIWGRTTKRQFDNLADQKKKDELQLKISKNSFEVNIRKVYWALIANTEKIRINEKLFQMAQKQLKDAKRRKANSVSDRAEVARFESLVHQRKGQLILLNYEKEMLYKNLRGLFPKLNGKELVVGNYNINKTVFEVLSCSAQIDKTNDIPYEHTSYDEVTNFLRSIQSRQGKIDNTYDDIDVKMDLKLSQIGVSSNAEDSSTFYGDYDDSIQDLQDNDRGALSAGLMVTIPFGEDRADTTKVKERLTDAKFKSNIDKLDAQVMSTHRQVRRSVKLLAELIKTQKSNSKALEIRVKEMKRKYQQARIPEYALIQDQDSLLQSDLGVVDTQLQVVNTILDYFSIFHNYPCTFNRSAK